MNIRNIDLNLLVAFDAVFDARSVTRAADRLALTQPTVSGMLKRLRDLFSDELFIRSSHGIIPTPRAEALAVPIKDLLGTAQALITPEDFDPTTTETTFKLSGNDYMLFAVISPVIAELRKIAPRARVSVVPRPVTGLPDLMARGEIDYYVASPEFMIPDLPSRLLCKDRYVCVARKEHPLRTEQISLQQLCAYDHLLVAPAGGSFSGPVDSVLASLGYRRRVTVALPTFPVLFEVLRTDDFLAFVPEQLLRRRRSELKVFEMEFPTPSLEIIANWHPRLASDPRHKWLRELVVSVAKELTTPASQSLRNLVSFPANQAGWHPMDCRLFPKG